MKDDWWDYELGLGDDLRSEYRVGRRGIVVVLLVAVVAAVRILLV